MYHARSLVSHIDLYIVLCALTYIPLTGLLVRLCLYMIQQQQQQQQQQQKPNERTDGRTNERTNKKQTNKQTNKPVDKRTYTQTQKTFYYTVSSVVTFVELFYLTLTIVSIFLSL